jgi:hypothetical protein
LFQPPQRLPDFLLAGDRVGPRLGQLIPARGPEQRVLLGVDALGLLQRRRGLLAQPRVRAVRRDRRVRGDLGAVDGDPPDPAKPGPGAQHQHLGEQLLDPDPMLSAEAGDRRVIGRVLRADQPKRHIGGAQPLDLP